MIAQTYTNWEIICVNDCSSAAHIQPTLDELAARDARVKVIHCETNRGVSVATNMGISEATGDYIAFMDHDDYLEPHALHRFAETVLADNPDMMYSDEAVTHTDIDLIQHIACRPSFSYDHYLSSPVFVHFIAARKEIVRRAGGLNEEMTISQDIDFVLRLIETCSEITHVPDILYRWRTHPASLGHQQQNKVNAMTRGALERHFDRVGVAVEFNDKSHFNFRDLRFAVTAPAHVAIIIPATDRASRLKSCVASLESTVAPNLGEIVILDQSSEKKGERFVPEAIARRHRVMRFDRALNPPALLNRGAEAAKGATHYLFLHDDVKAPNPGWLEHMLGYAQRSDVGIVGAMLLFPDETVQHAGTVIGLNGIADHVLKHSQFRAKGRRRLGDAHGILLSSRDVSAVSRRLYARSGRRSSSNWPD